jgi:arylsulfatase A-like enzyme
MSRIQRTGLVILIGLAAFVLFFHYEIVWCYRYLTAKVEVHERRLASPLPPCPGCQVILISLDTLRADRMGFLGSEALLTPNLDRIADKSIVFTQAYTNAFYTTPSHMTVFTSLYPATHQVQGKDMKLVRLPRSKGEAHVLDSKFTTLAEVLRGHGYRTYWDAPLRLKFLEFKEGFSRGFENFKASPFDRGLEFGHKGSTVFRAESLAALNRSNAKSGPAFMFLHSYVTHHPYIWREPDKAEIEGSALPYTRDRLLSAFKNQLSSDPENLGHMLTSKYPLSSADEDLLMRSCTNYADMNECFRISSEDRFWHAVGQFQVRRALSNFKTAKLEKLEKVDQDQLELYRRAYDSGVKFLDGEVGQMWKALEASGQLDNTMVIFMSDHGEELFENGQASHSSFYDHTAHIPLMIYHPKMKDHPRVDQLVSLVDVMPIVLSVLQIESPAQTQGRLPWKDPGEQVFGFALGNDYVREREWKLIRLYDGSEELYYLPLDPGEHQNLIGMRNPWVRRAYARLKEKRHLWELEQTL